MSPIASVKDAPAYDFYPERWSQGTRHMSKVERCDYLDLLNFQWTEKGIPGDLDAVARIMGYRRPTQIPAAVLEKFPLCADGKRRNARLEVVRAEQRDRIEMRKIGAAISHAKVNGVDSLSIEERQLLERAGRLVDGQIVGRKQVASNPASKVAPPVASSLPPPTTHHPPPTPDINNTPLPPKGGVREGKDSNDVPTTDQSRRIAAIFRRKLTTRWTPKEIRAYKRIGTVPEEDLASVEAYYHRDWPPDRNTNILRHDILTFLNNFSGEVDRARNALATPAAKTNGYTDKLPEL